MERLTKRDFESDFCLECRDYGEPNGCNRSTGTCDAYDFCRDAWDKLVAYEDTGLTPEECADLAVAEWENRLLVLPCGAGDIIYQQGVIKGCVISFRAPDIYWIIENGTELGKTWWLTRAEAEAALTALEEEKL
jgi:hypothetical protein